MRQNCRLDPVNSVFTVLRMHGTGYRIDLIQLVPYSVHQVNFISCFVHSWHSGMRFRMHMPRGMHIRACIHISMYLTKKLWRPGSKESEGRGSVHSPRKSSPLAMSSPDSLASDHHNMGETLFFLIYPTAMYIHTYLALYVLLYGREQKGISCKECHIVP